MAQSSRKQQGSIPQELLDVMQPGLAKAISNGGVLLEVYRQKPQLVTPAILKHLDVNCVRLLAEHMEDEFGAAPHRKSGITTTAASVRSKDDAASVRTVEAAVGASSKAIATPVESATAHVVAAEVPSEVPLTHTDTQVAAAAAEEPTVTPVEPSSGAAALQSAAMEDSLGATPLHAESASSSDTSDPASAGYIAEVSPSQSFPTAAPEPAPAPVVEEAAPEPAPAPVVEEAAPEPAPAPVVEEAAPEPAPAPVVEEAAPEPAPAPVVEEAAPEPAPAPSPSISLLVGHAGCHEGSTVEIAGAWDGWAGRIQLPFERESAAFTVAAPANIQNGQKYAFKFIIDGQWRHDEQQPHEMDGGGNVNNILQVT